MLGLLIVLVGAQGSVLSEEACREVYCKPGRECIVLENRETECVCISTCREHWKPVCGSDGMSYDNHCELHRTACTVRQTITPRHSGLCKGGRDDLPASEGFIRDVSPGREQSKVPLPVACFEEDRNSVREFLMGWFRTSTARQPWYRPGVGYSELLTEHFKSMDTDGDAYLDSLEMYRYISRNSSLSQPRRRDEQIRELCLDALVEEGDVDMDWRLDCVEFQEVLQQEYRPSTQVCKMEGRVYSDGADISVDCNGCVCACGKWVCTSNQCTQGHFSDQLIRDTSVQENQLTSVQGSQMTRGIIIQESELASAQESQLIKKSSVQGSQLTTRGASVQGSQLASAQESQLIRGYSVQESQLTRVLGSPLIKGSSVQGSPLIKGSSVQDQHSNGEEDKRDLELDDAFTAEEDEDEWAQPEDDPDVQNINWF